MIPGSSRMKAIAIDGGWMAPGAVCCAACMPRPDLSSWAVEGSGINSGGAMGCSLCERPFRRLPATFRSQVVDAESVFGAGRAMRGRRTRGRSDTFREPSSLQVIDRYRHARCAAVHGRVARGAGEILRRGLPSRNARMRSDAGVGLSDVYPGLGTGLPAGPHGNRIEASHADRADSADIDRRTWPQVRRFMARFTG